MILRLLRDSLLKPKRRFVALRKNSQASNSASQSILSYHVNPTGDFRLVGQTIQECLNSISARQPNDIAFKFCATQTYLSFAELKQRVDELAQNFMQLGLNKGDRVALMLPNVPELVLSMFALAQLGCISVLMNPAYKIDEVEYMLKMTKSKAVLILDDFKVNH